MALDAGPHPLVSVLGMNGATGMQLRGIAIIVILPLPCQVHYCALDNPTFGLASGTMFLAYRSGVIPV